MLHAWRLASVVVVAALSGCSCGPAPLAFEPGCSPLLHDIDCGLPYPNDFFLVDDATTPTGKRIEFAGPAKMLTTTVPVQSADINEVFQADGFSRHTPIVWSHGVRVDQAAFIGIFGDHALSVTNDARTALIEADTGRRIPHFVDVDPRATDDAREGVIMRPLEALRERTRYVVAVRDVPALDGAVVPAPEQFARLRDANVGDDPVLAPLLERFERDVFSVTDAAGIDRAALQLAWDFTTGSDEHAMRDMLESRALALAELARTPPGVTLDAVFEGDTLDLVLDGAPETWRLVTGTVTGPRVVDSDDAGALLARDEDGRVRLDGTTTFDFTAIIPASVRDRFEAAPVLLYGHGFFGSRQEAEARSSRVIAHDAGAVMIAIDWQGMSVDDIGEVVASVGGEVSKSLLFGERVMQAMVNWSTLTRAIKTGLLDEHDAFRRPTSRRDEPLPPGVVVDGRASNAGRAVIDLELPMSFLGISLGHVLGGTLSAHNADIERSMLMVGGANFSALMFRAVPFDRFLALLEFSLTDRLDQQKLHAHMQSQFDRFDPVMFAPYVVGAPLPGDGPPNRHDRRRVLAMMAIGDSQVPNLGTHLHAKAMGIPLLEPAPVSPLLGLPTKPFPATSGFVAYDLGQDDAFYERAEPADSENPVHAGLRRVPEVRAQMATFVNEGVIENPCVGPCVLELP